MLRVTIRPDTGAGQKSPLTVTAKGPAGDILPVKVQADGGIISIVSSDEPSLAATKFGNQFLGLSYD